MFDLKRNHTIDSLLARSTLYHALSLLFRHPDREHRKFLEEKKYSEWKEAAHDLSLGKEDALSKRSSSLVKALERTDFSEWLSEHERIFGHSAHGSVPPYELEYGDEHSRREPVELGDIAAFYKAFGLRVDPGIHERVDHAAVECDFLHFLTFKEAYALQHDGEGQAEICRNARALFLRDHLGRWMPVFTRRLSKRLQRGLTQAIAQFAFAFIVNECESLGIRPGPEDLPLRELEEQEEISCAACPVKKNFRQATG